jgi:GT2 family glycosyltransferase
MLVSVIIVSYNTAELTQAAVASTLAEVERSALLKNQTEIIVVDNNSSDNSVSLLTKTAYLSRTPIKVLAQKDNLGFAKANNLGVEHSSGEFMFFLNSDATFKPGSLETMTKAFLENPVHEATANDELSSAKDRIGMMAAKLLNPDGSDQYQGGDLPSLLSLAGHQLLLDDIPFLGQLFPSTQHTGHKGANMQQTNQALLPKGWVGGTALMVRKQLINEIGGFDNNIFMYGEDMEWCLRAKKHHWDVCIHQQAPVVHLGSASSTPKNALAGEFKAYHYIWAKHFPTWQLAVAKGVLKLGCLFRWAIFGTMGKHDKANLYKELLTVA